MAHYYYYYAGLVGASEIAPQKISLPLLSSGIYIFSSASFSTEGFTLNWSLMPSVVAPYHPVKRPWDTFGIGQ